MLGFVRISAAVPSARVAGVSKNQEGVLSLLAEAHDAGAQVVTFPELCLASYTARDLFLDRTLLDQSLEALAAVIEASRELQPLALVGLPLHTRIGIYNVAAAVQNGELLGVIPKSYLPNYREFEERRWFRAGTEVPAGSTLRLFGRDVPFGADLLFEADGVRDFVVGVEICEDLFVQTPPHAALTSAGATVVCNLSASNFLIGKAEWRKLLCASASDRGKCAYLYVAAGPSESSTDVSFDAHALVYENGSLLAESERFTRQPKLLVVDVDLEQLAHERDVTTTFGDCAVQHARSFRRLSFRAGEVTDQLRRKVVPHPFVPKDPSTLAARCWETFEIQSNALATRLESLGSPHKLVLGLSGGLDSTHAALVAANALDMLGRPREDLVCVTMPGFGSSSETQSNAEQLAAALSASFQRLSIAELAQSVLSAMGHPAAGDSVEQLLSIVRSDPTLADLSFENVQARMRTLLLMSIANRVRGIVVGTGDLSEKALGWSTYAGDQISMYDVNAGVPKTLIQYLIRWVANERVGTWSGDSEALRRLLFAILDTPISPELLPPDEEGKIAQLTEAHLGPYELHDFFLYHFVRHGRRPSRIRALCELAFEGRYSRGEIERWLTLFLRRFFANQFKRSCTPDGPKVGNVALSPRGDWRMPSDAEVAGWLRELGQA